MIGMEVKPQTEESDKPRTALYYLAQISNLEGQLDAAKRDAKQALEDERAACIRIAHEVEE